MTKIKFVPTVLDGYNTENYSCNEFLSYYYIIDYLKTSDKNQVFP